jgi:hypothetical protein
MELLLWRFWRHFDRPSLPAVISVNTVKVTEQPGANECIKAGCPASCIANVTSSVPQGSEGDAHGSLETEAGSVG